MSSLRQLVVMPAMTTTTPGTITALSTERFAGIAIKHVGYQSGPRVDPGRLVLTWAR